MKMILMLLSLVLALSNPAGMLQNRLQERTLASLKDHSAGKLYSMDYKADYRLEDFLACGFSSSEELKGGVAQLLLSLPEEAVMGSPMAACSAFQAQTPEGDVIYCRNFDYDFEDGASIMTRFRPRGAYRSIGMVSMNHAGLSGSSLRDGRSDLSMLVAAPYAMMDGINEKGLAVSVLAILWNDCARQYQRGCRNIMTTVLMRLMLDRAANVDEALDLVREYNFFADGEQKTARRGHKVNYHFLLSDASGKSAVLEFVREGGPSGKGKWVMNVVDERVATNFFQSEGWRSVERPDKRYLRICEALEASGGVMSEKEAMQLLCEVKQSHTRKGDSHTQWSVVYNLTRGTAKVCPAMDYTRAYEFSLRRCGAWRRNR